MGGIFLIFWLLITTLGLVRVGGRDVENADVSSVTNATSNSIDLSGLPKLTIPKFVQPSEMERLQELYERLSLDDVVGFDALQRAMQGYRKLDARNKKILTLIDFSKPSSEKRLCVIDLENEKVLHRSYVAHGKNSGDKYATSFSNKEGSYKSSLGFYLTEGTYNGSNGYSLVLNGLEKGINDMAKPRAIVIHGADYADPSTIAASGRLGRSFGCPALPKEVNEVIINTIKGGTLLYIYGEDPQYAESSKLVSSQEAGSNMV